MTSNITLEIKEKMHILYLSHFVSLILILIDCFFDLLCFKNSVLARFSKLCLKPNEWMIAEVFCCTRILK